MRISSEKWRSTASQQHKECCEWIEDIDDRQAYCGYLFGSLSKYDLGKSYRKHQLKKLQLMFEKQHSITRATFDSP